MSSLEKVNVLGRVIFYIFRVCPVFSGALYISIISIIICTLSAEPLLDLSLCTGFSISPRNLENHIGDTSRSQNEQAFNCY